MEEAEVPGPSLVDLLQATALEHRGPAPDLSSSAAADYLDQLQSLPLKSLLVEASAITADAGSVEGELTNLCYREYPTFISVHRCSAAVTSAFDDFSSSLGNLLDAVPALEDECRTFVRSTTGVQNARAKAALVQEHQDKLFDLLEIPQLMDTCVRNGYYQEALELSAHTDSLLKRYPEVELVQDVAKEVDCVLQLMLAQLLALLREPIKLPALVKTVGYLRRLGIIAEDELGLAFLISRLSNFRTQLAGLERDRADPVRYVRKYIDLFREHVFDIISQFTAIFLEGSRPSNAAAQLASFVGQCVDDLIALVAAYVPKVADAASVSSILVQLGYCSLAFARVGLDFSSLVTDPFTDAVQLAFDQTVKDATKSVTLTLAQAEKSHGNPAQALLAPEALATLMAADSPRGFVTWSGSLETLPTDLARFPPLAILVNAHLSALNSLRLLAPLHLHPRLAATQSAALTTCTHAIAKYVRQAVALSDPFAGPEKGHGRSSSGRAHLIRRNSETQLTPEARLARRREMQRACVAFADVWASTVVPLLRQALDRGVFESEAETSPELQETLDALASWVRDQDEGEPESPIKNVPSSRPTPNGSGTVTPMAVHAEDEEVFLADVEATAEPEEMESELGVEQSSSPVKRSSSPVKRPPSPVKPSSTLKPRSPSPSNFALGTPVAIDTPNAFDTPKALPTPRAVDTPAVATPTMVATPILDPPTTPTPTEIATAEPENAEPATNGTASTEKERAETVADKDEAAHKDETADEDEHVPSLLKPKPDDSASAESAVVPPVEMPDTADSTATAEPSSAPPSSPPAIEIEPAAAAVPSPPEVEMAPSPAAEVEPLPAVEVEPSPAVEVESSSAVEEASPPSPTKADSPSPPSLKVLPLQSTIAAEPSAADDVPSVPIAQADAQAEPGSKADSEATHPAPEVDPSPPADDPTPEVEDGDVPTPATPAESNTEPSRPPSPSGDTPTSGGGKKKKKKNKKKK